MSVFYLKTLNYAFKTESACNRVVEQLEASNASFEAMACSDVCVVGDMEVPYPPVKIGDKEYKPSEIKTSPEFLAFMTSFGGNGKAFDEELKEDEPTVEYGKKPYFKFDFQAVEAFVNERGFLPESTPQMIKNQWFFYVRRLLLLQEIKTGLESLKNG